MNGAQQPELTPGQQVLASIPITGPERTYKMTSTDKHKVTRGRYLTSNDPRGYIPVYEYPIGDQWIMLDAEDGYVLWTAIWKALGNQKADVVRMLDNMPELTPYIRRVRGGYLKIQGTWMKYEIAEDFSRRVAYNIREDLIPLFGPTFPATCLTPEQPGFGNILPGGRRRKPRASTTTRRPASGANVPMPDHVQAYYNAQVMGHSGGFGPGPSAYDPRGVPTYDRGPGGSYGPPGGPSPGGRSYWDGPLAYPPQPGYGSGMYAQPGQQSPYGDQMLSGPLPAGSSLQNTPTASPSNASSSPYYQVGLPSSAGPTRSGLGSPTSRVRYDPYNTAKNHPAASTGRPHSGGEPSWNAYTRLPPVDYTRVLAGGSMPRPGQTTGAGGARSAPVLDPALVGSSAPPPGNSQATAPPEHDDGPHGDGDDQHDASHDHREASPSAKEQEHGDDTGDDEEPNAQSAHSSMYSSRHGDNDDKGSHSLGLPISSARDDASS